MKLLRCGNKNNEKPAALDKNKLLSKAMSLFWLFKISEKASGVNMSSDLDSKITVVKWYGDWKFSPIFLFNSNILPPVSKLTSSIELSDEEI